MLTVEAGRNIAECMHLRSSIATYASNGVTKASGKGFGKRLLNQKETDSVKRRKLGGKAAQEFQLLSDRNESRQEHFPSRSGNAAADPLPNAVRGILLVGFTAGDAESTQRWFDGIEQGLKVACCQNQHLSRSMDDIFSAPHGLLQHDCSWEEQIEPVPRAAIFSGMTQKEMLGIAEFWSLSGVEAPIFASAVPAVQRRQLREVLKEVVEAYAQNLDSSKADLDSGSLREALRKKVAANNSR